MGKSHLEVYENGCKDRGIAMHSTILAELSQMTKMEGR